MTDRLTAAQLAEIEARATRESAARRDMGLPADMFHDCIPALLRDLRAARDVLAERKRQIEIEGWTPEHDDSEHAPGALANAAACYAIGKVINGLWPFAAEWWKPKDRRRDLVRAAALLLAEIERLDRAEIERREGGNG